MMESFVNSPQGFIPPFRIWNSTEIVAQVFPAFCVFIHDLLNEISALAMLDVLEQSTAFQFLWRSDFVLFSPYWIRN